MSDQKYEPGVTAELIVSENYVPDKKEKATVWKILLLAGIATVGPWNFYMSAFDYYMAKFEYDPAVNLTKACSATGGFESNCDKRRKEIASFCICGENETMWGAKEFQQKRIFNTPSQKKGEGYKPEDYEFVLSDDYGKAAISEDAVDAAVAKVSPGQKYKDFWNSSLSFLTMGTMLLTSTIVAMSCVQQKMSEKFRITNGLLAVMACLLITIVMSYVDFEVGTFFTLTLFVVVAINIFSGFYQCTVFQFCACFPGELYNAMLQGQAVGGIFANVMAVSCSIVFPMLYDSCKDKVSMYNDMATAFFLIAFAVTGATFVMYKRMIQMKIYQFYAGQDGKVGTADDAKNPEEIEEPMKNEASSTIHIILGAKLHLLSIYVTFLVTLALFPTLVAQVKSVGNLGESLGGEKDTCDQNQFNPLFFKIAVLLMFNVGDYFGRKLTSYRFGMNEQNSGLRVMIFSAARVLFYFFFMACNITGFRENRFFSNDFVFIFLMLAFGATNGWVSALAMEFAPTQFENPNDKLQVGSFTILVLTLGLLSGAASSFAVTDIFLGAQKEAMKTELRNQLGTLVHECFEKCAALA